MNVIEYTLLIAAAVVFMAYFLILAFYLNVCIQIMALAVIVGIIHLVESRYPESGYSDHLDQYMHPIDDDLSRKYRYPRIALFVFLLSIGYLAMILWIYGTITYIVGEAE
jgi:hypothetical protein